MEAICPGEMDTEPMFTFSTSITTSSRVSSPITVQNRLGLPRSWVFSLFSFMACFSCYVSLYRKGSSVKSAAWPEKIF